jgi:hypothetical protein
MRVYHGTTPAIGRIFIVEGINAHLLYPRQIHGPQDSYPGIFVTPKISVARRFGNCVISIEVPENFLSVPPNLKIAGASLEQSLSNQFEPQAFISTRIEPDNISIIECYENGYPFNPFEKND